METESIRLTSLAHGGGCGCKLDPGMLRTLLAGQPLAGAFPQLLVGNETADDAAVWELDDGTCLVATTDFFMPMVDEPRDFGRIAATNAISDIYAMGAKPLFALALLGMPMAKLSPAVVRDILAGGASICAEAGIPIAGGHSIDAVEPIYGLAVIGSCARADLRRNTDAKAGDSMILTKPLGVGVYAAAIKRGTLPPGGYEAFLATTTLLNRIGIALARHSDVHALTDVTGFGLLGHGLELARGSGLHLTLEAGSIPLLEHAPALAQAGVVTGASHRNWASYADAVSLPADLPDWQRHLLTDPQTSGGLLVACRAEAAADLLETIRSEGYGFARIVGRLDAGEPGITVVAG